MNRFVKTESFGLVSAQETFLAPQGLQASKTQKCTFWDDNVTKSLILKTLDLIREANGGHLQALPVFVCKVICTTLFVFFGVYDGGNTIRS